jgi:hypothetical protein
MSPSFASKLLALSKELPPEPIILLGLSTFLRSMIC